MRAALRPLNDADVLIFPLRLYRLDALRPPRASDEVDLLRGVVEYVFLIRAEFVLSLPLRVVFMRAARCSEPRDERLTNGPFCGYTFDLDVSALRELLRGPDVLPPRKLTLFDEESLPLLVLVTLCGLPVSAEPERLPFVKAPLLGYTFSRAVSAERDLILGELPFGERSPPERFLSAYGDGFE